MRRKQSFGCFLGQVQVPGLLMFLLRLLAVSIKHHMAHLGVASALSVSLPQEVSTTRCCPIIVSLAMARVLFFVLPWVSSVVGMVTVKSSSGASYAHVDLCHVVKTC